ncbi:MAG TPA: hypothetical protein VE732_06400 [Nitrososphaera sp.]|jgi:hypothetical protein|nr:hypothetical protein [Nitrososphaera sp.]
MPKSDDPIEQTRAQHKGEPENVVIGLVKKGLEKISFAGIAISYIRGKEKEKKEESFDNAILDILKVHDISIDEIKTKLESENVMRVVAVAVERIFWGASEKKIRRFATVVANAIKFSKEDQEFEDAASFLRALDELSEVDIKVLKHLYNHQKNLVVEKHTIDYNAFFQDNRMQDLIHSARQIGIQMDDFFARCARLSGYGLVLPLERDKFKVRLEEFSFRITLLGKRLVEMLINSGGETTDVSLRQSAGARPI